MQHLQATNYTDNDDDSDADDFDDLFTETGDCLDVDDIYFPLDDLDYDSDTPGSCVRDFSKCTDEPEDDYSNCNNEEDQMNVYEENDCISVCTELSFDAPPHSPLSPSEVIGMDFDDFDMASIFELDDFHADTLTAASSTSLTTNDDGVNSIGHIQSAEGCDG